MKSTIRAFIAINISSGIQSKAAKVLAPIRRAFPSIKWVDDENFHVTLKFLGANVPTSELHKIIEGITRACKNFEQFDLCFEKFGAFPDESNPRTLWIGVSDGVAELRALAKRIDDELEKLGYPPERREFSPHLTIGRTRAKDREGGSGRSEREEGAAFLSKSRETRREFPDRRQGRGRRDEGAIREERPAKEENFGDLSRMLLDRVNTFFGVSPVDTVVLYASELDRNGPKYEPLAEIDLAPLGTTLPEDDSFRAYEYDDEEETAGIDQDALETHLPEVLDTNFDVDALDAEVEEELRAICGDAFVKKSKEKFRNPSGRPAQGAGKKSTPSKGHARPGRPAPGGKPGKPAVPEDDDFPELDDMLFGQKIFDGVRPMPKK